MKTATSCTALIIATALLVVLDRLYPHVLSPQTYGLLLLSCAIALLVQLSQLKHKAKTRSPAAS